MHSYSRYVIHALIPAYEALGWVNTGVLVGTHHGHYSDLLEWKGEGEPKEPPALTERKQQLRALEAHMMDNDRSF